MSIRKKLVTKTKRKARLVKKPTLTVKIAGGEIKVSLPDESQAMLAWLHTNFQFGPVITEHLDKLLTTTISRAELAGDGQQLGHVAVGEDVHSKRDPLLDPPEYFREHIEEYRGQSIGGGLYLVLRPFPAGESSFFTHFILFPHIDSCPCRLLIRAELIRADKTAAMQFGCFRGTQLQARRRWPDDISEVSDEHRPHRTEFIDWIARICEFNGWTW